VLYADQIFCYNSLSFYKTFFFKCKGLLCCCYFSSIFKRCLNMLKYKRGYSDVLILCIKRYEKQYFVGSMYIHSIVCFVKLSST